MSIHNRAPTGRCRRDGIVVDHERAYIHWTNVDNGRGCVAITAAQAALRSFAYAITSARDEGDPQNTEKGQITTPGRPSDANVNAAAVGIDWL